MLTGKPYPFDGCICRECVVAYLLDFELHTDLKICIIMVLYLVDVFSTFIFRGCVLTENT